MDFNKNSTKAFLSIEWKKGIHSIPLFFLMLLASAALIGALVFIAGLADNKQGAIPKAHVAVVNAESDAMMKKGLSIVEKLEVV